MTHIQYSRVKRRKMYEADQYLMQLLLAPRTCPRLVVRRARIGTDMLYRLILISHMLKSADRLEERRTASSERNKTRYFIFVPRRAYMQTRRAAERDLSSE